MLPSTDETPVRTNRKPCLAITHAANDMLTSCGKRVFTAKSHALVDLICLDMLHCQAAVTYLRRSGVEAKAPSQGTLCQLESVNLGDYLPVRC